MVLFFGPMICRADRIVTSRLVHFGRVFTINTNTVKITSGCEGKNAYIVVAWKDIDEVVIDGDCQPKKFPRYSGVTAECTTGLQLLFAISFKDGTSTYGEVISAKGDDQLRILVAKGKGKIIGPMSDVNTIVRKMVCINERKDSEFKWPASFKKNDSE